MPAALAAGFLALYQPISPAIVDRLGPGFSPMLVAAYVATLVGLFAADAWIRDRRLFRLQIAATDAERSAREERQRSDDLRFVIDVAAALNGRERLESSLLRVLERVREVFPFDVGYVFLLEGERSLIRRGICPITAYPSRRAEQLAAQTLEMMAFPQPNPICSFGDPDHADAVTCPIWVQEDIIGVIVLEQPGELRESAQARLLAVADRLGASLNGVRLLDEVEARERTLRHAYRELRASGRSLARSAAREEAQQLGLAVHEILDGPTSAGLAELSRLRDDLDRLDLPAGAAPRRRIERIRLQIKEIQAHADELRDLSSRPGPVTEQEINDAVVGVIDLVIPDFKRAGIEVRISLANTLPSLRFDEGALANVLNRVLRSARASLRSTPSPRRLSIETTPAGRGVKVVIRDNSAGAGSRGIDELVRRPTHRAPGASLLRNVLRETDRDLLRGDMTQSGISVHTQEELGTGRQWTVWVRGIPAGSVL